MQRLGHAHARRQRARDERGRTFHDLITNAARAGCRHVRNTLCSTALDRLAIAETRVRAAGRGRDARDI